MVKCDEIRKQKNSAWNRWKKGRTEENWRKYIEARNECVRIMRMEKHDYERDIIQIVRVTLNCFTGISMGK